MCGGRLQKRAHLSWLTQGFVLCRFDVDALKATLIFDWSGEKTAFGVVGFGLMVLVDDLRFQVFPKQRLILQPSVMAGRKLPMWYSNVTNWLFENQPRGHWW